MNARKVLLFLGSLIAVAVTAIVAVALYTIKKVESEKNASKTQKAREARWRRTAEAETESTLTVTQDGIVEQPKPDNENGDTENNSDEQKQA